MTWLLKGEYTEPHHCLPPKADVGPGSLWLCDRCGQHWLKWGVASLAWREVTSRQARRLIRKVRK